MTARDPRHKRSGYLMLLDCARCRGEIIGPSTPEHVARFERLQDPDLLTFGRRIYGRPYCTGCVRRREQHERGVL